MTSSYIPSSASSNRLEILSERRQRADSSDSSANFESQLTTAVSGSGTTPAASGTASASRQSLAASTGNRQSSAASSSPRLQDDPARSTQTSAATSDDAATTSGTSTTAEDEIVVYNTPFGPMIKRPATAATTASTTTTAPLTQAAAVTTTDPDVVTDTTPTFTTPEAAIEVLGNELRSQGIDPSMLNISYAETPVYYPGGYYTNRLITLELGNGQKECYDVNLMLKNPWLTALEMRRFMAYYT